MRRGLSIFFILLLGLGPLVTILDASDESRLPPCCRRHGAHHCAMSDAVIAKMVQTSSGTRPVLTAPSHCPLYPANLGTMVAPVQALAPSPTGPPMDFAQPHEYISDSARATVGQVMIRAGRGPPIPLYL